MSTHIIPGQISLNLRRAIALFLLACLVDIGGSISGFSSIAVASAQAAESQVPVQGDVGRKRGRPEPYEGDLRSVAKLNIRNAVLEEIYAGLNSPWAFEILSGDTFLVSEFSGQLKLVNAQEGSAQSITGLPELPKATGKNQIGLMDVALHPDFDNNRVVFFSHAVAQNSEETHHATAVSRAILQGAQLTQVEQILVATPYGDLPSNFGGALAFDGTGHLLVGSGDRGRRDQAQNPGFLTGKILRMTTSGGVPDDNPFVGDEKTHDLIFALGVRNPQGLTVDPVSGLIFESEHGPMGGDEVNIIEPGANYGWPLITYGANYSTQRIGRGTSAPGLVQPLYYYLPSLAISPIEQYRGEMFTEWEGDLLVGALKGEIVSKLDYVDGVIKSDQRTLRELGGRVRDIKIGADGSIYFLVQEDGRILRLYRDPTRALPKERNGRAIYRFACSTCHSGDSISIPTLSDKKEWRQRLQKGKKSVVKNAIEGIGDMPAGGFCENCTDLEIEAAVEFMLRKMEM